MISLSVGLGGPGGAWAEDGPGGAGAGAEGAVGTGAGRISDWLQAEKRVDMTTGNV